MTEWIYFLSPSTSALFPPRPTPASVGHFEPLLHVLVDVISLQHSHALGPSSSPCCCHHPAQVGTRLGPGAAAAAAALLGSPLELLPMHFLQHILELHLFSRIKLQKSEHLSPKSVFLLHFNLSVVRAFLTGFLPLFLLSSKNKNRKLAQTLLIW